MEDLQFEQKLDASDRPPASKFIASYIDQTEIGVDNKLKFEVLFSGSNASAGLTDDNVY